MQYDKVVNSDSTKLKDSLETSILLDRPISNWRNILSEECQVYVLGENYIAKRFDAINYKFCEKNEAKEIVIDNLYALLRFKYFPKQNEKVDKVINDIVSNFTLNLKTTLKKVSFEPDADCNVVNFVPDGCVSFRNGVYDFRNDSWLFKYDTIYVEHLKTTVYQYNPKWIITWYVNIDFEPLPFNINEFDLEEFIDIMKDSTQEHKNYCFELLYNMSHDIEDKFDLKKFIHIIEILGYTLQISFSQNFVQFIGSGGNGKNSLFDGCFTHKVVPTPTSNSIKSFETDKFITGALFNHSHNFFFETGNKIEQFDTETLKNVTGSMYQTIEIKGVQKFSSIINCKNIFSANDQDDVKFNDNTQGFRRRYNVCEIWYSWDDKGRYLRKGDYYDVAFGDDYKEIKIDNNNLIIFIYFGMYGLKHATDNFSRKFKFTYNDWKLMYSTADVDLKDKLEKITINSLCKNLRYGSKEENKVSVYDLSKKRLFESKDLNYESYDDFLNNFLENDEESHIYFLENDFYLNLRFLQKLCDDVNTAKSFTSKIKKIFGVKLINIYNNQPYAKCRFINNHMFLIN